MFDAPLKNCSGGLDFNAPADVKNQRHAVRIAGSGREKN
jgi:hypothetical protein